MFAINLFLFAFRSTTISNIIITVIIGLRRPTAAAGHGSGLFLIKKSVTQCVPTRPRRYNRFCRIQPTENRVIIRQRYNIIMYENRFSKRFSDDYAHLFRCFIARPTGVLRQGAHEIARPRRPSVVQKNVRVHDFVRRHHQWWIWLFSKGQGDLFV